MDDKTLQDIITASIQIGVYNTLAELGLLPDNITEQQANKKYGKRLVNEWRIKGWITAYPSGNSERAKYYFRRSELETASRMMDIQNSVPINKIFGKS